MAKPDLANLKRVIDLGSAEAARDAGVTNFALKVSVRDLEDVTTVTVDLIVLTPEQAAAVVAEHQAEERKRESGN